MISCANQLTGFYMTAILTFDEFRNELTIKVFYVLMNVSDDILDLLVPDFNEL